MSKGKKCPVCSRGKTVLKDKKIGLYNCLSCSHTFTLLPKKKQEKYGADYFEEEHKNWFNNINYGLYDFVIARLSELLPVKKIVLLDVGCGRGHFLRHIRKKAKEAELWGIDLAKNSAPGIHFVKGDFLGKKIPWPKFNAICSFAVAEHVDNPGLFAKKISIALEKGGIAAIMTVDNNSLVYRAARAMNRLGNGTAYKRVYSRHHLQHYTKKSLRTLMEDNGFETVLQKSHNGPLKAIDIPKSNFFAEKAYLAALGAIFLASTALGCGMYQTIICRKKTNT
jgi:SAM-dependent methyltransferase